MNRAPLVSCIVIFLNAERFLEQAIESIFAQSYAHWELLLVDDGSSDGSTKIARRWAQRYPEKVHYLEHESHRNLGMSASRNAGAQRAKGEYIAFLDADDIWMPTKLEEQAAILEALPEAAMVYGRTLLWYSWTGNPEDALLDHTIELGVRPERLVKPPGLFFLLLRNKVQTPTTCNFMIRRSAYEQVGGFVERFRGMYEDQAFYAKVNLNMPVFVSGRCWAKYRQHPESYSAVTASTEDYCQGRLNFLNWLAQHLAEEGIGRNTAVWGALQKEIWLCSHPGLYRFFTNLHRLAGRITGRAKSAPGSRGSGIGQDG